MTQPKYNDIEQFIPENLRDIELFPKVQEMMKYVMDKSVVEMTDFRLKYRGPDQVSEDTIKQILYEMGYDYIVSLMDTITNFEFNTLLSYVSLVSQLKGSRKGLELVLKLLGFDSVIHEWWEDPNNLGEPWTYEIVVIANNSNVPDIFKTLEMVQVFSRNYVYAQISNINIKFAFENFAEKAPIMGGFVKAKYRGRIIERAY